jgi:phosphoribosylaminoimidazole (AIR) synthetase
MIFITTDGALTKIKGISNVTGGGTVVTPERVSTQLISYKSQTYILYGGTPPILFIVTVFIN